MIILAIMQKNSPLVFFDFSSIFIVIGGTLASTMVSFSFKSIKHAWQDSLLTFQQQEIDYKGTLEEIVRCSYLYKIKGPLALEKMQVKNPFLQKGIDFVVDQIDVRSFKHLMMIEHESLMERQRRSSNILQKMGDLAPSWGLIGTLVGLVLMMLKLESPSQIGAGMGLALLTTFYGAVISNLVLVPLGNKIEERIHHSSIHNILIIEGLYEVRRGESTRIIKDKLISLLGPTVKIDLSKKD